jgi:hypothetical protein
MTLTASILCWITSASAADPGEIVEIDEPRGKIVDGLKCYTGAEYQRLSKIILDYHYLHGQIATANQLIETSEELTRVRDLQLMTMEQTYRDLISERRALFALEKQRIEWTKQHEKSNRVWRALAIAGGAATLALGGTLFIVAR